MLQKNKFRHFCTGDNANTSKDDGTTMIRIIFSKCDASTKSGVDSLKSELSIFVLDDYEGNAPEMLDVMHFFVTKSSMSVG